MVHIFLLFSSSLDFFFFFGHDFFDSGSCCKYRNRSDSHLSGNCGVCQNVGCLLLWRKGPNMLQQGAVRSCKRRQLCLNTFETFPLLVSQRLFKS